MTTHQTKQPGDTDTSNINGAEAAARTQIPSPSSKATPAQTRPRITGSRWWRWGRGVFAAILVLAMVVLWLDGLVSTLVLFGPAVVVVATVVQRIVAKVQGQLAGFAPDPFDRANRPYVAQFALRVLLAALVLAAGSISIPRFAMTGTEYALWSALVAVPALVFAGLQLLPARTVSRSLNVVAAVAAAFLAFQLIQVHFRSGLDDAVSIAAPFEDGEWTVTSGGNSTLVSHHYAPSFPQQQYAIDFVIDRDGRVHEGDSVDPASYYAWDEPLLAPADGIVVEVQNELQDWPVGQRESDIDKAAGNYVLIDIGEERYVLLAHVRQGTATVTAGDRVEAGDIVGRVGNSGNTGMPHLHLQVQDFPEVATDMFSSVGSFPMHLTNVDHIRGGTEHAEQQDLLRRNDIIRIEG